MRSSYFVADFHCDSRIPSIGCDESRGVIREAISGVLTRKTVKAITSYGAHKPFAFENRDYRRQQLTCRIRLRHIAACARFSAG